MEYLTSVKFTYQKHLSLVSSPLLWEQRTPKSNFFLGFLLHKALTPELGLEGDLSDITDLQTKHENVWYCACQTNSSLETYLDDSTL